MLLQQPSAQYNLSLQLQTQVYNRLNDLNSMEIITTRSVICIDCHIQNIIEGIPTKASTVITTTTDKAITTKQGKITNEPEIEYYKNINTTPHDILNSDLNILSSSPSKRRLG